MLFETRDLEYWVAAGHGNSTLLLMSLLRRDPSKTVSTPPANSRLTCVLCNIEAIYHILLYTYMIYGPMLTVHHTTLGRSRALLDLGLLLSSWL